MLARDEFNVRISEAHAFAAWSISAKGASYDGRSAELRPRVLPWTYYELGWKPEEKLRGYGDLAALHLCIGTMKDLVCVRRAMLGSIGLRGATETGKRQGRLVLFEPWVSTGFRVTQRVSQGIVDEHDEMGWDLWVCIHAKRERMRQFGIVAYVPLEFDERVDAAVRENPDGVMSWIEEADVQPWEGVLSEK